MARRALWVLTVALVWAAGVAAVPSSAAADSQCPAAQPSSFGSCGPTFTLPEWGDAGGWKSPDQYSTIQFGDVLGNGRDQLIGRSADGIEIWDFDTQLGQWRPAVDAQGKPMILTGFADPPPLTQAQPTYDGTDWTAANYYDTIQVADVLGDGRDQIIARANSGITVWSYTPGSNGAVGAWSQVFTGGPFSDASGASDPQVSATIHTADLTGDGKADVFGANNRGLATAYEWNGSGFSQLPAIPATIQAYPQGATLQGSPMIAGRQELWWADNNGMTGLRLNDAGNGWTYVTAPALKGPCALNQNTVFYSTCRVVNVTGSSNVQVVGRGVDGLHAWQLDATGSWQPLATLGAFSDANGWAGENRVEDIQYANLDGSPSGQQEVVSRGPNGVVVYKYDTSSGQWDQLPSASPISLDNDPWGSDPSYSTTLHLGDATGDGRQDTLIARGPYGVRTWSYTAGSWTAPGSSGYPGFSTPAQQAAYATLNALAAQQGLINGNQKTVRDIWTAESAPTGDSLGTLQGDLAAIGACTGEQTFSPPQYQSCTPPSGTTSFTAQDWTAVVNELLSEAWDAQKVVGFYAELDAIRQKLFIYESVGLPAIAGTLNLSAATNTPTSIDMGSIMSGSLGVAASVTFAAPELSAALWVAAELSSMLPSASPDLTNDFNGTYSQLQNVIAAGITQTEKALASQSLQVRSNLNLARLVAQLRQRGTWALDDTGMESVSNEAFALGIYKTLLPLMYTRYFVINCRDADKLWCTAPSPGFGVVGYAKDRPHGQFTEFSVIGPNPRDELGFNDGTPCEQQVGNDGFEGTTCQFSALDQSIGQTVWGLVAPNCDYQPGNPNTAWTFGCNLGVDPATTALNQSLSAKEYWNFPFQGGNPVLTRVGGAATTANSGATASLDQGARLSLRGTFRSLRRFDLSRATVLLDRVLFDPTGGKELVRQKVVGLGGTQGGINSSPLGTVRLQSTGHGNFQVPQFATRRQKADSANAPTPPNIELKLRPRAGRSLRFALHMSNVVIPVPPAACAVAKPGSTSTSLPFLLTLKLRLQEPGAKTQAISASPVFTCRRNATGTVRALTVLQPRHPKSGPALSIRIKYPRRLTVGHPGTLTAIVSNRTHSTAYDVFVTTFLPRGLRVLNHSPHAIIQNRRIVWRLTRLRRGHSHTVRVRLVPGYSAGQCATVSSDAILRTHAKHTACIRVIAARTPPRRTSGLG